MKFVSKSFSFYISSNQPLYRHTSVFFTKTFFINFFLLVPLKTSITPHRVAVVEIVIINENEITKNREKVSRGKKMMMVVGV